MKQVIGYSLKNQTINCHPILPMVSAIIGTAPCFFFWYPGISHLIFMNNFLKTWLAYLLGRIFSVRITKGLLEMTWGWIGLTLANRTSIYKAMHLHFIIFWKMNNLSALWPRESYGNPWKCPCFLVETATMNSRWFPIDRRNSAAKVPTRLLGNRNVATPNAEKPPGF